MSEDCRKRIELAAILALGIAPFYVNGLYNPALAERYRTWFWIVEVTTWIALPVALILIGCRRRVFSLAGLGLSGRIRGRERPFVLAACAVVVGIFAWLVYDAALEWASTVLPTGWSSAFSYAQVIPPSGPETGSYRLLVMVHLSLTAGFVEELYYRGAFDRLFPRGWVGGLGYVTGSSLLFAGAHWESGVPNLFATFCFGVLAASVFRLTYNLWPLIAAHVIIDWFWFLRAAV